MLDQIVIATSAPTAFHERMLSPRALLFLADLVGTFRVRLRAFRADLVAAHAARELVPAQTEMEMTRLRSRSWRCQPLAGPVGKRRVELVGAVDRRSILASLEARPDAYIADFDDATAPTWDNLIDGQLNLRDAVHECLDLDVGGGIDRIFRGPPPPILVRPRPLTVDEWHLLVGGSPIPAALFDVGLYCFHNAERLAGRGDGPFFSLTKLQGRLEARLWNDVFVYLEDAFGLARGVLKASVRIDTVRAAFEVHEILWELRDRTLGLACGQWDYVRDLIATRADDPHAVLSDRRLLTVDRSPLAACADRIVTSCRVRGVPAVGPMSQDAPLGLTTSDLRGSLARVFANSSRDAAAGFDATRVAHPKAVAVARAAFAMATGSTPPVPRSPAPARELLRIPASELDEPAIRKTIHVGFVQLIAWLEGRGRVANGLLLEDASSGRAARAQIGQWLQHRVPLCDGTVLSAARFRSFLADEALSLGAAGWMKTLFEDLCVSPRLERLLLASWCRSPSDRRSPASGWRSPSASARRSSD